MRVSIRSQFDLGDWKQLHSFLVSHYWPNVALASKSYFQWQLAAPDESGLYNMATAWDGKQIVGVLGYVVRPTFWGTGRQIDGAWLMALMVDPAYRHGVGLALLRDVQRRFPLIFSVDVKPEAQRILTFLGFIVDPPLARYIALLDSDRAKPFLIRGKEKLVLNPIHVDRDLEATSGVRDWNHEEYSPIWGLYPSLGFGTVRSSSFLRWRYLEHPHYRFALLACGPRERPAVCAYRIEHSDSGATVGRMIDFFFPEDALGRHNAETLIRAVTARLALANCAFVDHVTSCASYGSLLQECGWVLEDRDSQQLALRLQPIDSEPSPEHRFALVSFASPDARSGPLQGQRVTATRGDGDADRPHIIES